MKKLLLVVLLLLLFMGGGFALIKDRLSSDDSEEYAYKVNRVLVEHIENDMVTSSHYSTLGEAISAAQDGDVIKLFSGVDLGTDHYIIDKSITISGLDGNTLSLLKSSYSKVLFTVQNGASFKLMNIDADLTQGNMLVEIPAGQSGFVTIENVNVSASHFVFFRNDTAGSLTLKNVVSATTETAIAAYYDSRVDMHVEDSTITTATYHCIIVDTINENCEIEIKNSTLISSTEQTVVVQNVFAPVNLNIVNSTINSHSSHALVAKSNTDTVINIENSRISATLIGVYVTTGTLNIKESTINSTDSFGITVGTVTMCVESSEIKSNTTYAVISTHASTVIVNNTKLISDGSYALHTSAKASITLKGNTYLMGVESGSRDILYSGTDLIFADDYAGYGFLVRSNNGSSYDLIETLDVAVSESKEYVLPAYAITEQAKQLAEEAGYRLVRDDEQNCWVIVWYENSVSEVETETISCSECGTINNFDQEEALICDNCGCEIKMS